MASCPEPYRFRRLPAGYRQHGYTLHDVLITLAVVSIVAIVATPTLLKFVQHHHLASAANSLITALMTARSESIKRNVRAVLCPSRDGIQCLGISGAHTAWHDGYLLFADNNANHRREPEEPLLHVFDKTLHIRIYTTSGRGHVTYQPNGQASGTNATFLFCGTEAIALRSLVVSNTGRARLGIGGNACPPGSG